MQSRRLARISFMMAGVRPKFLIEYAASGIGLLLSGLSAQSSVTPTNGLVAVTNKYGRSISSKRLFGNVGAALGVPSSLFGVVSSGHSSGERESTHDSANGGPVRRLLGSVGSLPLGTHIGTAIIVTCLAWVSVTWGFISLLDWRRTRRNRVAYGLLMLFGMLGLECSCARLAVKPPRVKLLRKPQ